MQEKQIQAGGENRDETAESREQRAESREQRAERRAQSRHQGVQIFRGTTCSRRIAKSRKQELRAETRQRERGATSNSKEQRGEIRQQAEMKEQTARLVTSLIQKKQDVERCCVLL